MPEPSIECPVEGCGYTHNMNELEATQERPLILESTRSHRNEDAWRDTDHFNLDEELARLRRAVHEVRTNFLAQPRPRHLPWVLNRCLFSDDFVDSMRGLLGFICEAFDNIDENLVRLGPLPRAWFGSSSLNPLRHIARAASVSIHIDMREGRVTGDLHIRLINDLLIVAPLEWFPALLGATNEQLHNFRVIGDGVGIQWPELDVDISIRGILLRQGEGEEPV